MCFSATASFTAAGVLAIAGFATLGRKPEPKRIAFALIPLFFALHQAIEGFVWLSINEGGPPPAFLVYAYLFFAQVFWPAYTPFSVLAMEDDNRRKWALYILLVAGVTVSLVLGAVLLQNEYIVSVRGHSLSYTTDHHFEDRLIGLYLVATAAPLLISRHRYVMAFGGAVLVSSVVTELLFHYASASVWCFFAAISSLFVYLHIRRRQSVIDH